MKNLLSVNHLSFSRVGPDTKWFRDRIIVDLSLFILVYLGFLRRSWSKPEKRGVKRSVITFIDLIQKKKIIRKTEILRNR